MNKEEFEEFKATKLRCDEFTKRAQLTVDQWAEKFIRDFIITRVERTIAIVSNNIAGDNIDTLLTWDNGTHRYTPLDLWKAIDYDDYCTEFIHQLTRRHYTVGKRHQNGTKDARFKH